MLFIALDARLAWSQTAVQLLLPTLCDASKGLIVDVKSLLVAPAELLLEWERRSILNLL
jgi:hypothetical protein